VGQLDEGLTGKKIMDVGDGGTGRSWSDSGMRKRQEGVVKSYK